MIRVSAPASSANLGPGFDVVALALDIRLTVTAAPSAEWKISGDGDAATSGIVQSVGAPPMSIEVVSEIPVGRGLGSSAALRAAVAAAALAMDGEVDRDEVFRRVAAGEGHPDNAAAAVYGGLVAVGPGGSVMPLAVHPSLLPVVAVPAYSLATERARRVLSAEVPRDVAVRTAARLAFLVEGLRTADAAVLAVAADDEIHESPRASLSPLTAELMGVARSAGALHAAWSGAGPAVIALTTERSIDDVAGALADAMRGDGEVFQPGVDRLGIVVGP